VEATGLGMNVHIDGGNTGQVGVLGVPFALGGWFPELREAIVDMTHTPQKLRARGFVGALGARNVGTVLDLGDVALDPTYCLDGTAGATNRTLTAQHLPVVRRRVRDSVRRLGPAARLVVLGGECTLHPAVLAGLRDAANRRPLALIWFDAHGDFHTATTTQTGSIWGFPLALACGRGDPLLVEASGGGSVPEAACAHLGGQAMDEGEARLLAASEVAHFGSGMLSTGAGLAAFSAWLDAVVRDVHGVYVAFDMDVLDESAGSAVALPEPNGMPLATAREVLEVAAARSTLVGIGLTTLTLAQGDPALATAAAVDLTATALGVS
jgi:arginase family enzyme